MSENIEKISVLMDVSRDAATTARVFVKRKRKPGAVWMESEGDSITISEEARRLLACAGGDGSAPEGAVEK